MHVGRTGECFCDVNTYIITGVFLRWTGMDHWTTGMDYWNTGMDYWNMPSCHKFEVSITIVHLHACARTAKNERLF